MQGLPSESTVCLITIGRPGKHSGQNAKSCVPPQVTMIPSKIGLSCLQNLQRKSPTSARRFASFAASLNASCLLLVSSVIEHFSSAGHRHPFGVLWL